MQRGKARRGDDKREKVRKTRTLEPGSLDTVVAWAVRSTLLFHRGRVRKPIRNEIFKSNDGLQTEILVRTAKRWDIV